MPLTRHLRKLIRKLEKCVISGQLLLWVKYFLLNWRQQIRPTFALFDWASVISGVPQGSVFGSILFMLFINDLPRDILSKLFLFADDAKLLQVLFSAACHQELQSDKDHLIEWPDKCQSKSDTSKCKVVHVETTNTSPYTILDLNDHKYKKFKVH